jgi:aspartate/methionine/tyrosine aminotransferase
MTQTPIESNIVRKTIEESGVKNVGLASIRELVMMVAKMEAASGKKFIRMEMGIPGFAPPSIAVEAEIEALKSGVGSQYPPFDGIPDLKSEISRFVKKFINADIDPKCCLPTVGAMQGCYMSLMVSGRRNKKKDKVLFLDPGFPVNKLQAKALGLKSESFDVYDYRGEKLRQKLETYFAKGDIAAILYSNPNNPSWICFTDTELRIIGELCTQYEVIALEDMAYIGMDFREDYASPGVEPYIPSVSNYTDNYILLISGSKSFSLAGQRIGMAAISNKLYHSKGENLTEYFESDQFGTAFTFGAMYTICSGVCHSTQIALAATLKAVNEGEFNFVDAVKEYGERAKVMKELFKDNNFYIVYDMDDNQPIADGFYFTAAYPGLTGTELVEELLYYGISAISLITTGSEKDEGIRVCVSLTGFDRFNDLEERLKQFHADHKNGFRARL